MRISDPRTFGGKHLTTIEDVNLLLQGGSASVGQHGYAFLDATGKVDTSLIPPLAISQTYVTADNGSSTKLDLIKSAITAAGVERGDIVIITAKAGETVERTNAVCGTVIFTKDVADKSTIVEGDFAAVYVPGGSVTSVNGKAPVNGEVTLALTDLGLSDGNVTAIKKLTEVDDSVAYDSTVLATKDSVDTLAGRVTTAEGKIDTLQAGATALSGRMDTAETNITTLSGTKYIKYVDNFDTDPADPVEGTIYVSSVGQTKAYVNGEFIDISVEVSDDILSGDDNTVATVGAIKTYVSGQIDTVNEELSTVSDTLSQKADLVSGTVPLNQIPTIPGFDKIEDYDLHISSLAQVIQRRITVGEEFTGSMTAGTYEPNITEGNIYTLSVHTAEGNDSILRLKEYMRSKGVSEEMLKTIPEKTVWINDSGINVSVITDLQNSMPNKLDKVTGITNNIVVFGDGNAIKDSTYKVATDTTLSGANDIPTASTIKSYVDNKAEQITNDLANVKEKAIQLVKITRTWTSTDKTGDTYTKTIPGHVIQVCDAEGWVIPGVKFDGTNSIITVKMDSPSGSLDGEPWDYYVAKLAKA